MLILQRMPKAILSLIKKIFALNNHYFIVICFALVSLFFFQRHFLLFRDYSILWEGAYRLSLGQMPFRDFGTPVGPVSFLIPALFFKLFSPSWFVMQLSQMFENAILLILAYQLLQRLQLTPSNINKAIACFAFFYLVFLSHPWYNSGAFLCFLASMVLLLVPGYLSVIAAGLMGGLCFLAKQDYGVMNFCLGSLVLLLTRSDKASLSKDISFGLTVLTDFKRMRSMVGLIVIFAMAFTLPVLALIYWVDGAPFFYWFNYGQPPHEIRKIRIWDFKNHGNLLIPACIGFYFAYRTRRIDLLFAGIFFICSFVVSSTSGLDYTAFFFFLFLPLLVQTVRDRVLVRNRWVSLLLLVATLACIAFPAKYFYRLVQTTVLAKAEPFSFRHVYVTRPVQAYPASMPFFKNVMGSDDSILMMGQLQEILKGKTGPELQVLNISELTPLYAELGSTPPLHYPLWYHNKISLFPREIELIDRDIDENKFDVIILQNAHGQANFEEFLARLQRNSHYQTLRERGFVSPTTSTGDTCFEGYCPNHLYVYVRKSLLK
jgi:hypothetical protein